MARPIFHVDFDTPENLVFNRAKMRRVFFKIGQIHMRDARRLVMRRGVSAPGENPGYQTGALARSIGYWVPNASSRRAGLMVRIAPGELRGDGGGQALPEKKDRHGGNVFYPAALFYGVHQGAVRQKKHHKNTTGSSEWRIAPRNNFMVDVLESRKAWTRYILQRALRESLRPPRVKRVVK